MAVGEDVPKTLGAAYDIITALQAAEACAHDDLSFLKPVIKRRLTVLSF
jgi:hypothetical protein